MLVDPEPTACTKSERSVKDAGSSIGVGATDIFGCIAISLYGLETSPPRFYACRDIPGGGVLLALSTLLKIVRRFKRVDSAVAFSQFICISHDRCWPGPLHMQAVKHVKSHLLMRASTSLRTLTFSYSIVDSDQPVFKDDLLVDLLAVLRQQRTHQSSEL